MIWPGSENWADAKVPRPLLVTGPFTSSCCATVGPISMQSLGAGMTGLQGGARPSCGPMQVARMSGAVELRNLNSQ